MKKTMIAMALASILPISAFATEASKPEHMRGFGPKPVYEQLDLTETQKQEIKKVMEEQRATTDAKISSILTPTQNEKLKELKAKRLEKRHEERTKDVPPPPAP